MARTVSEKVRRIHTRLYDEIRSGLHPAGAKFPSTRALADRYRVSYQTAHRILACLVDAGLLETRHGSGTYVAGNGHLLQGVLLLFHPRARRKHSFGATMKGLLEMQLNKERIPYRVAWSESAVTRFPHLLPVVWEAKPDLSAFSLSRRAYAVVLNDRRLPGLDASHVDSLSIDDYSGGVCAAQMLLHHCGLPLDRASQSRAVVLAAIAGDARCDDRIAGFRSLLRVSTKQIVHAGSWDKEAAARVAPKVLALRPGAVFCCNDRLAEGLLRHCRKIRRPPPPVIGFDNAPIAEQLHLTTVAIPWQEMVASAMEIIKKRLKGNRSTARRQIFAPHPVFRTSCHPSATG